MNQSKTWIEKRLNTILAHNYRNVKGLKDALGRLKGICQRSGINGKFEKYLINRIVEATGIGWNSLRDRKYIASYRKLYKYCEKCKIKEVEQIHHKTPLSQDGIEDYDNYKALCKECHEEIHNGR